VAVGFFEFLHQDCIHSATQPTLPVREATASQQPMKTSRYVGSTVLHDQSCCGLRETILDAWYRGLLIANVNNAGTADTRTECRTDRLLATDTVHPSIDRSIKIHNANQHPPTHQHGMETPSNTSLRPRQAVWQTDRCLGSSVTIVHTVSYVYDAA